MVKHSKWSKHNKPFISAPVRSRAILSIFLDHLAYVSYEFKLLFYSSFEMRLKTRKEVKTRIICMRKVKILERNNALYFRSGLPRMIKSVHEKKVKFFSSLPIFLTLFSAQSI